MCQGDTHNDVLTPFEEDALDAMLTHATALREHPPGSDAVYNAADALRYARRVARFASAIFELERAVLDPKRANLGKEVGLLIRVLHEESAASKAGTDL